MFIENSRHLLCAGMFALTLSAVSFAQEIRYESAVQTVGDAEVEVSVEVGILADKPVSITLSITNLSSEIRELSIPSNKDEMSRAIYIRHNGVYLKEYWRLNQVLEHSTQGAQLGLSTETLNPKEIINWSFSIPDLVDDAEAYNALESYQRMRISFSFPMTVSLADGSILSGEAITIRWIKN